MGVSANDHPRTLAFFTEAEFRMAINSWTLDGVAPPPGLWAQAGIVGRVCRLVCGRPADDPVEQVAPPPVVVAPEVARTVKVSMVADQANDAEIPLLDTIAIQHMYATYRNKLGANPPADED
eukprot:5425631-Amphidinium_carterae.1